MTDQPDATTPDTAITPAADAAPSPVDLPDDPAAALAPDDLAALKNAITLLESPGLAVRMAELVGTPLEVLLNALPDAASGSIHKASDLAMRRVLGIAVATMRHGQVPPSDTFHKLAVFTSGAIGGAAGLPGLAVELPVTTGFMFRSIADIARGEGEDLRSTETMFACMQVFALGGPSASDDGADSAYLVTRIALSKTIADATRSVATKTLSAEAPAVVRFITKIAARFGIVVSYKTAAQLAPIIGALGGAAVNTLFMSHYQNVARGHFTVRRLERAYSPALIQAAYRQLRPQVAPPRVQSVPEAAVQEILNPPAETPPAKPADDHVIDLPDDDSEIKPGQA